MLIWNVCTKTLLTKVYLLNFPTNSELGEVTLSLIQRQDLLGNNLTWFKMQFDRPVLT